MDLRISCLGISRENRIPGENSGYLSSESSAAKRLMGYLLSREVTASGHGGLVKRFLPQNSDVIIMVTGTTIEIALRISGRVV